MYRWRGTKQGLSRVLSTYLKIAGLGEKVEVSDNFTGFPYYFQVQLTLNDRDPVKYWQQAKIAKAIIDQEKPAQTYYALRILTPTMQITRRSVWSSEPFTLFEITQEQTFTIEVKITSSLFNNGEINQLPEQLVIELQGNSQAITLEPPELIIEGENLAVKYTLTYQHFQDNLDGFNVKLSNRTDEYFTGNLTIKLYFQLNQTIYDDILLREERINLSPVLKICNQNDAQKIIEGNTIFRIATVSQMSGMRITEYLWKAYIFRTFTAPKIQELEPDITAIIEKIELEAVVEVTQPNPVTPEMLNKITVRIKDNVSNFHLLTPETTIEDNKIRVKRSLYYYQFMQTIDSLTVTIKNLNNLKVQGKVTVQASLEINQELSSFQLLDENFELAPVPLKNILQICYDNEVGEDIIRETIPTILGTTTQSLDGQE